MNYDKDLVVILAPTLRRLSDRVEKEMLGGEALVHQKMWDAAIAATGDDTIRSSVMDIARGLA